MIECLRCGECCTAAFYNGLRVSAKELRILQRESRPYLDRRKANEGFYILQTKGNACPFRTGEDGATACSIYETRPCQCRLFHCGRKKKDDPMIGTIPGIRELILGDPEYAEFKTKMDVAAIAWGNAHGWSWKKIESE